MIKRFLSMTCMLFVLLTAWDVPVLAQWPLGKELPPGSTKTGESGGYLTGSGRFQVFVSPNIKGHTFMLDSETGRVWIFKKDNASGDISIQRIPVDQLNDGQVQGTTRPKN
ncbi:MAG: hypothetical protein NTY51_03040 [Deltaproteobacteria bacterium]|nr:hypothetical protein [Deltaproteobacteria bacterium]